MNSDDEYTNVCVEPNDNCETDDLSNAPYDGSACAYENKLSEDLPNLVKVLDTESMPTHQSWFTKILLLFNAPKLKLTIALLLLFATAHFFLFDMPLQKQKNLSATGANIEETNTIPQPPRPGSNSVSSDAKISVVEGAPSPKQEVLAKETETASPTLVASVIPENDTNISETKEAEAQNAAEFDEPQQPATVNVETVKHHEAVALIGTNVNLRDAPSLSGNVSGQASEPLQLLLLEELKDGWCKVELESNKLYIWGAYLNFQSKIYDRMLCVDHTLAFEKPNRVANEVTSLDKNSKILAVKHSQVGEWQEILLPDGMRAWVLKKRLQHFY